MYSFYAKGEKAIVSRAANKIICEKREVADALLAIAMVSLKKYFSPAYLDSDVHFEGTIFTDCYGPFTFVYVNDHDPQS